MESKNKKGRPEVILTENQIRYAMENTESNAAAAQWLHVDIHTYKKFAKLYLDASTGKTLFEKHRRSAKKTLLVSKEKIKLNRSHNLANHTRFHAIDMLDIMANKHPSYTPERFKERLIYEGWVKHKCDICGFAERRLTDFSIPLFLIFKDGNKKNFQLDNVQLICHNCHYIHIGPRNNRHKLWVMNHETLEPELKVGIRASIKVPTTTVGPYYRENQYIPEIMEKPLQYSDITEAIAKEKMRIKLTQNS